MRAMVVVMAIAGVAHADAPFPDLPKQVALVAKVSATSTFSDKSDPTDYSPWRALVPEVRGGGMMEPGQLWTAWCEGKKDEGIGETLTVTFAEPTKLDAVKIAAGVWRTDALFKLNNQITSLDVIADGKTTVTVKPSGKDYALATIGASVTTLAFKIGAVKKGKANDTCISNIDLIRDGNELPIVVGVDATAWAALPAAIQAIQKALEDGNKKGLDKLVEFPLQMHDATGDIGYGGSKDATVKSMKELLAACKSYDARAAKAQDWVDPLGCPTATNYDPSDDREDLVKTIAPGFVDIGFPAHRELIITWRLHWSDGKWKLTAIGDQ